jgi:TonB family protein
MGKIVKFCSECEEGFAEKFGFCPNCGAPLEAFEMNPLQQTAAPAERAEPEFVQPEKPAFISSSEPVREPAAPVVADTDDILELNVEGEETEEIIDEPAEPVADAYVPAATAYSSNGSSDHRGSYQEFSGADVVEDTVDDDDDGFHVTVIEEKNVKQRNNLLLGTAAVMLVLIFGGFIYSLFAKSLDLAAISGDDYIAIINDFEPVPIEEPEEAPKPADTDSGGGGGGGREEEMQTQRGRMADQSREEPLIRPDKNILQRDKPELEQPRATTVGDKKFPPTIDQYGIPDSPVAFGSSGRGKGGGMGEGEGGGQGSGQGRGAGTGQGEGFGGGRGKGTGDGTGDGNTKAKPQPEPPAVGPSKPLNITYKPKPKYTDEARQKNITGNVRVRVTFLPSGQIGSVTPVSNLGYGLTEQAIAAARQMRFEPEIKNGRPVAVTRVVVFNFTIY